MEGNIIFDNVLELANPVNNCFKHKQCYFCPKMCFIVDKLISIFSYNICFFRSSEATGPGSPTLVVNGNHPTAAAISLVALLPRLITASPLDAQDRCLPNAFPRVLVEALLTFVGEDLLAILVQVVRLVEWSFR